MSDYRDADERIKKTPEATPRGKAWFRCEGDEMADGVTSDLVLLRKHQTQRLTQYVVSTRLYGNLPPLPFGGLTQARLNDRVAGVIRNRLTFNVVDTVVDTLCAKIVKSKPRALYLTSGGDYRQQRRAQGLTKFNRGVFYEMDSDAMTTALMRDACVYGDGMIHVYDDHGRVGWDRALAVEFYCDEMEGYYGKPRSLHRVRDVDRDVLTFNFPDFRSEIADAPCSLEATAGLTLVSDMVQVRESWHLPSGPEAKDGRHVISIEGHCLTPEDECGYEDAWFPFARLGYAPRLYGYWNQGLAEKLQPIQMDLNEGLETIRRSHRLAGSFKIMVENGSKIVKEHLNNEIGTIVNYSGTPPSYVVPPAVQAEIYAWVDKQIQRGYEQAGISQLSANSQKPAGLDSGRALREYNDIETDRFTITGQQYERLALELGRLSIETVKKITKGGKKYRVSAPAKGKTVEVEWSAVHLDDGCYQAFAIAALPEEPAGRLAKIQEYAQAGYYTPREAKRLMTTLDTEAQDGLSEAMEDHLTSVIEAMAYEGETYEPEPYDDLALAKELALEVYARGKTNGLEEERLELLRVFMQQLDALAAPPPMAGAVPGAGAPQAVPRAPPVSDMLPTAPAPQGMQ